MHGHMNVKSLQSDFHTSVKVRFNKKKSGITKSKEHLGRPSSSRNGDGVAKV
jgi:hypothetical protein